MNVDYSITFTLNTDAERFSNWLEHEAQDRFFRKPIENKDGSHIVLQPMRHEHRKNVTVCSFEGVYEPAGDNRVAKLMGVIFKFELMPETDPNKFEVKAICKRKGAMSAYAIALVAIALTYPESKGTIMQQVGIDDPEDVTMIKPAAGDNTKETYTGDRPRKYGFFRATDQNSGRRK